MKRTIGLGVALMLVSGSLAWGEDWMSVPREKRYLQVVRQSADALLEKGRDGYGPKKTAMILSLLDRRTGLPLEALPKAPEGVRKTDRTGPYGSNASVQMDLYRVLQETSRMTGDSRYGEAARDGLVDFLRVTQHPSTGLLAWGEHLFWNCRTDAAGKGEDMESYVQEPKRDFIYFDLLYAAEPQRMLNYERGEWENQIANHDTGDFNRHCWYNGHRPGKGNDFPKEGGYFIDGWARAYEKSHEEVFRTAVRVLAKRYLGRMNSIDLMDFESANEPGRQNRCVPLWATSLALECEDARHRVDPETAELLRTLATRLDRGYLALKHDPAGKGFICWAETTTGTPLLTLHDGNGYTSAWGMGYGMPTTGLYSLLCYTRMLQVGPGETAEGFKKLVIAAADRYIEEPSGLVTHDIWAAEYGVAIFSEIAAYRATGRKPYLDAAFDLGDTAILTFWGRDGLLPRASSRTDHYEAMTYADTLMLSLLALHEYAVGAEAKVPVSDLVR